MTTQFPVGFHAFHADKLMNFQMNRWYATGIIPYEVLVDAAKRIDSFSGWVSVFEQLAAEAEVQGNWLACATYLRAAQFFSPNDTAAGPQSSQKLRLYEACMQAYGKAYQELQLQYAQVPFDSVNLPVIYRNHPQQAKGTILIHGGYDSFIQEFVPFLTYLYEQGFDVIMFEGPGQGAVLHRDGLTMTPQWELCTSAVLDYFDLKDVTLIGISLGGYLAARAAAYDVRIQRVVLYDLIYDFYGAMMHKNPPLVRLLVDLFLPFEQTPVWKWLEKRMQGNLFAHWLIEQGYHVFGVNSLPQYLKTIKAYHTRELSPLIKSDVLVLAGAEDIYTIYFNKQIEALCNARSVKGRTFTKEESASHHCQVGNIQLALTTILNWVESKQG